MINKDNCDKIWKNCKNINLMIVICNAIRTKCKLLVKIHNLPEPLDGELSLGKGIKVWQLAFRSVITNDEQPNWLLEANWHWRRQFFAHASRCDTLRSILTLEVCLDREPTMTCTARGQTGWKMSANLSLVELRKTKLGY